MPIIATSRRQTPKPDPGLKVPCVELGAAIKRLNAEGKKVVAMTTKREGMEVNYYLQVVAGEISEANCEK